MNDEDALRRFAQASRFEVASLAWVEKVPSYLVKARLPFLSGAAYERAVNATEQARLLRSNLFVVLRSQDGRGVERSEPS
ncbi:MAG: hypothetical protein FJ096_00495 [Deltaproteobacteria bacterium]|nr:hypothetical protein [Deltaproteobacteria bacterium]